MMNRPIDGTVSAARLLRRGLGVAMFDGVVIRGRDGRDVKIGRVVVSSRLADSLVEGRSGRFYLHDVAGLQGMHAVADEGGARPTVAFPMLAERASGSLAVGTLAVEVGGIMSGGLLPLFPFAIAVLSTAAWAVFRASREAILHDLAFEAKLAGSQRRYVPAFSRY